MLHEAAWPRPKTRRLRRRSAVVAAVRAVRPPVPWPRRVALPMSLGCLALVVGWWIGAGGAPWLHLEPLRDEMVRLEAENVALRGEVERARADAPPASDSQAVMDRSTLAALAAQVERLEADNGRLKEDVAFFESATADHATMAPAATAAIRRFQVTVDPDTHAARFRLLITQDSKATRDFVGTLRLTVALQRQGRAVSVDLPAASGASEANGVHLDGDPSALDLKFKSYKRVDGSLRLPVDAVLRSVEVRILERGTVVARQAVPVG